MNRRNIEQTPNRMAERRRSSVMEVAELKLRQGSLNRVEFEQIVAADSRFQSELVHEESSSRFAPTIDAIDFTVGGLSFTSSGALLVADIDNHCVKKYDGTGRLISTFGSAGSGNGQFAAPQGIASNFENEKIVVADYGNHRVQLWSGAGRLLVVLGSYGNAESEFSYPTSVAVVQSSGVIAVADRYNHRIQLFDSYLRFQRTICPSPPALSEAGASFTPVSVGATPSGTLVVTDGGSKTAVSGNGVTFSPTITILLCAGWLSSW